MSTSEQVAADWIAADWGTSRLRVWAMAGDAPLARAEADAGMGRLAPGDYEGALLALIEPWLPAGVCLPVIACGMVGARQGWVEASYMPVPCAPLGGALTRAPATDPRLDVWIVPGLSQDEPADVMRGEETQIAGLLAMRPDLDGLLCLPGTHSKWVRVAGGQITQFQTVMTGELFGLLAEQSVLRHSVGQGWDDEAFAEAVVSAHADPVRVTARLFALRAGSLLAGLHPDRARATLSGLLIGVELAAVRAEGPVTLVGGAELAQSYATALRAIGVTATVADGTEVTLRGLAAARRLMDPQP